MNTKALILLTVAIGAITMVYFQQETQPTNSVFQKWKAQFGIKFESSMEEKYRQSIFLKKLEEIEAHNADQYKTYTKGINQFSALTKDEFAAIYLGLIVPQEYQINADVGDDISVGDIDWVQKGAVTAVKNQGQCGSCWAFSTTGSLEGLSFVSNGDLQNFSEQQLVDCSFLIYGNLGCNGGMMDNAFKYVRDHGIVHQDEYEYVAKVQACKKKQGGPFKISGFTDVKSCNDLANALTGRPVSVAVDATNWPDYKQGVFNNCDTKLNHGVLLVGASDQWWRVKNSWTQNWGESGYIKLARGNTCGICNTASYPNM